MTTAKSKSEEKRISVQTTGQLPSEVTEPPKMLVARMEEVRENVQSLGDDFQLQKITPRSDGLEIVDTEAPVKELTGIIIFNKKINTYYEGAYNADDVGPPTCFSHDGIVPAPTVEKPQNPTCKGCPKAEWGTNAMKSGKACANRQPIYLLRERESDSEFPFADVPRVLSISPTSLKEFRAFLMNATERGDAYWKLVTKITTYKESVKDNYVRLKFQVVKKLTPDQVAAAKFLREYWSKWTATAAFDKQGIQNEAESTSNETANGPQQF